MQPELYQINWIRNLAGIADMRGVRCPHRTVFDRPVYGKTSLSTSAVPYPGGNIIYGPVAGVILSATYAIVSGFKYRSKFNKYIFNFSNQLIAAMLYTVALHFFGRHLDDHSMGMQAMFVVASRPASFTLRTLR